MLRNPLINKLVFPAGRNPQINMRHRAAAAYGPTNSSQQYRFGGIAMVATGSGMMSIVGDPNPPTISGTGISYGLHGILGPCAKCSNFTSGIRFDKGANDGNGRPSIMAAIIQGNSFANGVPAQIVMGVGARGFGIADTTYTAGGFPCFYWNGVTLGAATTARLSPNVPYFVIACANTFGGSQGYWIVKDLTTGRVQYETTGSNILNSSDTGTGTYYLFNTANMTDGFSGYIAAFMWMSSIYGMPHILTVQEALEWADDPWSFWYPDPFEAFHDDITIVGSAAAAGRPNRLPLLGVG